MVDVKSLPVGKIVLAVVWFFFLFFFISNQVHWSRIETVEACSALVNPIDVESCKVEMAGCAALPVVQQRGCALGARVNSGLVLDLNARILLFLFGALLILFGSRVLSALKHEDSLEKDVPKEVDHILRHKIIAQLATPSNNYLKNVLMQFDVFRRNRAGFAKLFNVGLASVDGKYCVIDPRRGIAEPVKSELASLDHFRNVYGKDSFDGLRLASPIDILDHHFPIKEKVKEVEKVDVYPNFDKGFSGTEVRRFG